MVKEKYKMKELHDCKIVRHDPENMEMDKKQLPHILETIHQEISSPVTTLHVV